MKGTLALALLAAALPAFSTAAMADETDPPAAVTVTGSATVVSDYRFRGISQTDKQITVQGGFSIAHESGLYVAVWGSGIDDYVAAGGDTEVDLSAGYRTEIAPGTTVDIGALYYYYPGAEKVIPGYDSDFLEAYASVTHAIGPATGKLSVAYAPKQNALSIGSGPEDNLYIAGDLSASIPDSPIGLSAHLGHNFGPSYLSIGKEYTDWSLGATFTHGNLTAGVSYVDTNKAAFSPSGRNISGGGVVATLGVAF